MAPADKNKGSDPLPEAGPAREPYRSEDAGAAAALRAGYQLTRLAAHPRAPTSSSLSRLIGRLPEEIRLAALFTALSFFVIGLPRVFTNTAAFTLFLEVYGAQALPYTYVATAVTVPAVGYLYLQLEARLPFVALVLLPLVTDMAVLAMARLGLGLDGPAWPIFAVTVWVEVEWVLTSLVFWGLAQRSFDIRQAKRLFGVIGAGGPAGMIIGGFATPALLTVIGPTDLLWLSLGSIAIATVLVVHVTSTHKGKFKTVLEENAKDNSIGIKISSNRAYLVLIVAISAISILTHYFIDIAFYSLAQARYPDESALAAFIGVFSAAAGALSLLCDLLVFAWLMRRSGLLTGLLVLPLVTLTVSLGIVGSGLTLGATPLIFWLVAMTKLADESLRDGIQQPSFLTLYQPLPPQQRTRMQAINETAVEPVAAGASGLTLLLLTGALGFGAVGLVATALALLAAWLVLAWLAHREYLAVLTRALAKRRLGESALPLDEKSLTVVKGLLASTRPGEALHCLALLQHLDDRSIEPIVGQSLSNHSAREARLEALRIVERRRLSGLAEVVASRLADPDPATRGAALRALAALHEVEAAELLIAHLDAEDATVRSGALVGLMRYGGIEGVLAAGPRLLALATSPDTRDRRAAADMLGELGIRQFYRPLLALLADPDPEVRQAALRTAKTLNVPQLWPLLLNALRFRPMAGLAADALVAAGEEVYSSLEDLFRRADTARYVRQWIVWIYGRGPKTSSRPVALLKEKLTGEGRLVRREIMRALRRQGFRADAADAALVVGLLLRTATTIVWIRALLDKLDEGAETRLLRDALVYELGRHQDRVFRLLSFLYPAAVIDQARYQYTAGTAERRAYAVELLDTLVSNELRALVVSVLEATAGRRIAPARVPHGERYTLLTDIMSDDAHELMPWVHACALHAMGRFGRDEFRPVVVAAARSVDPLIRDTAAWALRRLVAGTALPTVPDEPGPVAPPGSAEAGYLGWRQDMLSTVERVLILKEVSIFSAVPDEYLADVASMLTEIEVPAATTIIQFGDIGRTMYIIIVGRVRVHRDGLTLAELGERDVFGELSALDPEPRSASVEALEDTRLFQLSNEHLDELMSVNIEISRGIIRMLCRRFRNAIAGSGTRADA